MKGYYDSLGFTIPNEAWLEMGNVDGDQGKPRTYEKHNNKTQTNQCSVFREGTPRPSAPPLTIPTPKVRAATARCTTACARTRPEQRRISLWAPFRSSRW